METDKIVDDPKTQVSPGVVWKCVNEDFNLGLDEF